MVANLSVVLNEKVVLKKYGCLKTMKICLGISLELHHYDAILMKFHDILGGYFTASVQGVNGMMLQIYIHGTDTKLETNIL